jgi:pimeloyl-ACP methyl ester carboxylesterase
MPAFERGDISLHYEMYGEGYPVLLLAPGGMRSAIDFWNRAPFHPVRELADRFQLVAMDQRNAGTSRAPVTAEDGWATYTADHLALLDHLGIERCHLLGQCIGGSFILSLIARAPARVSAAVLAQPIGFDGDNRGAFHEIFTSWAAELVAHRPDVTREALEGLERNFYASDFVFSVSREDVRRCPVPLLVLRGNDVYHPAAISEEIVTLAPLAELVPRWREPDALPAALTRIREFLASHAR